MSKPAFKQLIEKNVFNKFVDKDKLDVSYIYGENFSKILLYFGDTVMLSFLYFFLGIGTATFINKRICQELDKTKSKFYLFFETTGESAIIILGLFLILWVAHSVPTIVPNPDKKHYSFRKQAEDIILAVATFFAHEKLSKKYAYLLNNTG